MGFLRVYLALCVVIGHAGGALPFILHDGTEAVQIFFIISGFYMAFILDGKYGSPKQFYVSRSLRIFVPYYMALVLVVLLSAAAMVLLHHGLALEPFTGATQRNGVAGIVISAVTNVTVLGQDAILYLSQPKGAPLGITLDFTKDPVPLWSYQLLPQCWTVSIELMFYLLAPFLARLSSRSLLGLLVASTACRVVAYELLGLVQGPWTYRFFPFEIALFVLGMLTYRFYRGVIANAARHLPKASVATPMLAAGVVVAISVHAGVVHVLMPLVGFHRALWLSYLLWPFVIPLLFLWGKENEFDRAMGELSFPIYLLHFALIEFLWVLAVRLGFPSSGWPRGFSVLCGAVSVAAATILYRWALIPFENWRRQLTQPLP